MKYVKLFNEHTDYESYIGNNPVLPNLSMCLQEEEGHFTPYNETKLVAIYNITDTTNPTTLYYKSGSSGLNALSMEIDGGESQSLTKTYTFSTTGEHIIRYTLQNSTNIGQGAFYGITTLKYVYLPDSVTTLGDATFRQTGLEAIRLSPNITSIG